MIKNVVEREVWFFKYRYIIFSRMYVWGGRVEKVIYCLGSVYHNIPCNGLYLGDCLFDNFCD